MSGGMWVQIPDPADRSQSLLMPHPRVLINEPQSTGEQVGRRHSGVNRQQLAKMCRSYPIIVPTNLDLSVQVACCEGE
jgi:hypothetical protein